GEKLLAWRVNAPRLWDALLNLEFTLSPASPADAPVKGKVEMDMTYLATTGTPQVKASSHLPATVVALSRLGLLFGRAILQTHFWDSEHLTTPTQRYLGPWTGRGSRSETSDPIRKSSNLTFLYARAATTFVC